LIENADLDFTEKYTELREDDGFCIFEIFKLSKILPKWENFSDIKFCYTDSKGKARGEGADPNLNQPPRRSKMGRFFGHLLY